MLSKNLGLLWCTPLLTPCLQFCNFTRIYPRTIYLGRCSRLSNLIERGRDIQLLSFRNWFFIQLILSSECDQLLCLAVAFWYYNSPSAWQVPCVDVYHGCFNSAEQALLPLHWQAFWNSVGFCLGFFLYFIVWKAAVLLDDWDFNLSSAYSFQYPCLSTSELFWAWSS